MSNKIISLRLDEIDYENKSSDSPKIYADVDGNCFVKTIEYNIIRRALCANHQYVQLQTFEQDGKELIICPQCVDDDEGNTLEHAEISGALFITGAENIDGGYEC